MGVDFSQGENVEVVLQSSNCSNKNSRVLNPERLSSPIHSYSWKSRADYKLGSGSEPNIAVEQWTREQLCLTWVCQQLKYERRTSTQVKDSTHLSLRFITREHIATAKRETLILASPDTVPVTLPRRHQRCHQFFRHSSLWKMSPKGRHSRSLMTELVRCQNCCVGSTRRAPDKQMKNAWQGARNSHPKVLNLGQGYSVADREVITLWMLES